MAIAFAMLGATANARAQDLAHVLPGSENLPVIEGSRIPEDCHLPARADAAFDMACVVFPSEHSDAMGDRYMQLFIERGWYQGPSAHAGLYVVRNTDSGCVQGVRIVADAYPGSEGAVTGLWFTLERDARCIPPVLPGRGGFALVEGSVFAGCRFSASDVARVCVQAPRNARSASILEAYQQAYEERGFQVRRDVSNPDAIRLLRTDGYTCEAVSIGLPDLSSGRPPSAMIIEFQYRRAPAAECDS